MPYHPTADAAVHALDPVQLLAAQKHYAWSTGLSVSLSSATGIIETILQPGEVIFNGETISIGNVTVEHPDGDPDQPRWDAVCVTNRDGTVEAVSGIPAEPVTDPETGNTIRGESAFKPAPSDEVTDEMVCLALVWIPAGATINDDLSDTSDGGVPNPVIDRRVEHTGHVRQVTRRAVIDSSGWYRIAGLGALSPGGGGGGRATGLITIRDIQTGLNSSVTVSASCIYSDPALSLINSTAFTEPHGAIEGVRIVTGSTNDGAGLDVNVQLNGQPQVDHVEYSIQNNYHKPGWQPMTWESASVPSGFDTTVIETTDSPLFASAKLNNTPYQVSGDGTVGMRQPDRSHIGGLATLSSQVTVPDNTNIDVPFDIVQYDDYNTFDSTAQTFTIPRDGTYLVIGRVGWLVGIADNAVINTTIAVGGTDDIRDTKSGNKGYPSHEVMGHLRLQAGQTIKIRVKQNNDLNNDATIAPGNTVTRFSYSLIG